jgi:NAD dependent epimerase/dehydratase
MDRCNVLVTGADGFIGSNLTELLLEKGYKVKALSYYNSFNFRGWLEDIPPSKNLEIVSGDIRDPFFIKEIMKGSDVVLHLAALIAIPYSYSAPESYIETNIIGTLNVCQAAKELQGIRVLITSTSEVYGTARYIPIDENHPKQPQSPYSATKIGADAIALSYYNAFNLPVTIVRPFNTYGPRQSARAVIPAIITQIAAGLEEIKLGDIRPSRDLNFVKDTCEAILLIMNSKETIGREINICSNTEISIKEVFEMICQLMKKEVKLVEDKERFRPMNSEVFRLKGDNSLIGQLTGYAPKYDLETGLKLTCEWFSQKRNLDKYKAGIYNL